jgi:cytoskeletal protein RodZ
MMRRGEEGGVKSEHFGSFLKQRRLQRGLTLGDLSRATKIKERSLELVEEARFDALPAPVFARGFVLAYARQVGLDANEALARLHQHLGTPPAEEPCASELPVPEEALGDGLDGRRRFGVALVVLVLLIVATLTLSLLLRHGPPPAALS